jgi:hypothetical protein
MSSTIFIGRNLQDEDVLFAAIDRGTGFGVFSGTLESLLSPLCKAVKNKETISFNEVPYVKNPLTTYLPLTREQFQELERMYERKVDMKIYTNPFVRE